MFLQPPLLAPSGSVTWTAGSTGNATAALETKGRSAVSLNLTSPGHGGLITNAVVNVVAGNDPSLVTLAPLLAGLQIASGSIQSITNATTSTAFYVFPLGGFKYFWLINNADASFDTTINYSLGDSPFVTGGFTQTQIAQGVGGATTQVSVSWADAYSVTGKGALQALGFLLGFNGVNYDRTRNNNGLATLTGSLASAARTATTQGANFTNYNWTKLRLVLNVSIASGTGGLQVQLLGVDSISTNTYALNALPTAIVATGTYAYDFYPGSNGTAHGGVQQTTDTILPRTMAIKVTAGDASSYTYSVSIEGLV